MRCRLFLLLCFLFLSFPILSQQSRRHELEQYLEKSEEHIEAFQFAKGLDLAKKASVLALKNSNSKYLAKSYYLMSKAFFGLEMKDYSLIYINKGLSESGYTKSAPILKAQLHDVRAMTYINMGLYKKSRDECKIVIETLKGRESQIEAAKVLSNTYQNIANSYYSESNRKLDSVWRYSKLSVEILKGIPEQKIVRDLTVIYGNEGLNYLELKDFESARFYFQKVTDIKKRNGITFYSDINDAWSQYYFDIGDYENSLKYALKAVEEAEKSGVNNNNTTDFIAIYEEISETYAILGDTHNANKYLNIFVDKKKIKEKKHKEEVAIALDVIKNEDLKWMKSRLYVYLIIFSVFIAFLILLYIRYRIRVQKERREIFLKLQKREIELTNTENEKIELKQKVNESFEEIIQLAKDNNPELLIRFWEVYPELKSRLLAINPDLKASELTLCAYIYLGFSTKEIADYTFKSIKTIQNRKNSLRKRLYIDSEKDINVWMVSL